VFLVRRGATRPTAGDPLAVDACVQPMKLLVSMMDRAVGAQDRNIAMALLRCMRPVPSLQTRFRTLVRHHRAQLALSIRVTIVAVVSLALAKFLQLPLPLWAVMTAIIVTQMSVGRSLKATFDYLVGTLGGAICGGAVGVLVPHSNELALLAVLAMACGAADPPRREEPQLLRGAGHGRHRAVGSRDYPRQSDCFSA